MCNIQQLHGMSILCCLWAYTVTNENESQGQPGLILYLLLHYTGSCDKTSNNSAAILSDFFKHSNITQFYMHFPMIIL